MSEKVQNQATEMQRRRVENFLKDGEGEGNPWKDALENFEEQKRELLSMTLEERNGLIDHIVNQWLPRVEQPSSRFEALLKKLGGADDAERASLERERGDLNGSFREFLISPSIESAVPILGRLNIDLTNSEKLEEFTRRVGRTTFKV